LTPTKPNGAYIGATAITRGIGGEAEVRDYHLKLFDEANARLEEQTLRLRDNFKTEVALADGHIVELSSLRDSTPPYHELPGAGVPWTNFARFQVCFFATLSALLLAVGLNTNALVLMASGIPGFEKPVRAYLFSLIPIGIAVALKALGSLFESRHHRWRYLVGIWVVGLLFSLTWARLFAITFPGLTQTAADIVRSLSDVNEQSHSAASGGLVFVGVLAEAFIAAGCWLMVQKIVEHHRPWIRRDNPAFRRVESELSHWQKQRAKCHELEGILAGKLRAIADARNRLIADAVAQFLAAVRLAANDQYLEDFISGRR